MGEAITALRDAQVPTILVIGGILFLFLGVVGRFFGQIEVTAQRQKWSLVIGVILLIAGIMLDITPTQRGAFTASVFTPTSSATPTPNATPTAPTTAPTFAVTPTLAPTGTSTSIPSAPPTRTNTASPTSSPTATFTKVRPTIPPITPPPGLRLLLKDDFNGVLNSLVWDIRCEHGTVSQENGQLQFHLPLNQTANWQSCSVAAKGLVPQNVRLVVAHIVLKNGKDDLGWIGMFNDCGGDYLNLAASQSEIAFEGQKVQQTPVESGFSLPLTRTLIMDWLGNQARFTIPESNLQRFTECPSFMVYPPTFGVGVRPKGSVDGSFDEVEIWGVPQ